MLKFYKFRNALTIVTLYLFAAYSVLQYLIKQSSENVVANFGNRTLLIVAHPDDETMFFGPTVLNLLNNNKSLLILCLTNGNAYNDGSTREQEFYNVVGAFGSKVTLNVVKNSKLQDDMTVEWDEIEVIGHIQKQITSPKEPIHTILTFDSYGVSGHTNHQSINKAVGHMKRKLESLNINILTLNSVSILRKYTFFLDSLTTYILGEDSDITLALSLAQHSYLKEVLKLHQSQMVWFRRLYMNFSRYMFLNDLRPML